MEVHQYEFSKQKNTSTDLANKEVAVKKEDPFKHSEQFSTNSALCDTEIKSEEDFYRDIKDEIIENEPNPNLNINLEEIATDFYGDLVSGKNDPQLSLIKKPVKKEKLCISNEYEIKLTKSDEVDIHLEHVKIEKVEPSGSELFFSCEVCKKVFVNEKDLIEHKSDKIDCIALEVDENDWNQEDKLTQDFGLHLLHTTPLQEEILTCTSDNKESRAGTNKGRPFRCEHCLKSFSRSCTLSEHQKVHSEERPFQCKVCSKAFKRKYDLLKHERLHEEVKPYQCESCSESFEQKAYLRKHEKKHAAERFQCEACSKYFLSKSDLTYHGRIHADIKPFQCKICPKAFRRNFHLLEHEKLHAGVKPFHCKLCSKAFALKAYLHIHEKTHAPKTFRCETCSESFAKKRALSSHKKSSH